MVLRLREPVNGLTHLGAAVLSVGGLGLLVHRATHPLRPWHLAGFVVFGAGLIGLYAASAVYHCLPLSEAGLSRLRKVDHSMVFVLIAATYTPICLVPLRGPWGWGLLATVWGLALGGIGFKLLWMQAPRWLSTAIYLGMGWVVVVAVWPLVHAMEPGALGWLAAGGLFYTVGAVVYALRRPDPWPGRFGFHEIFHVLCILGSASHFWVMYRYVSAMG